MPSGISGAAVASTAAGGILIWSGVKGADISQSLRSLISGQKPAGTNTSPISGSVSTDTTTGGTGASTGSSFGGTLPIGDLGASSGTAASNQAIAKLLAAPYGWSTGANWNDLVALWNRESGWNAKAQNPSSTAYGIAQFLDSTWAPYGAKTSSATLQIKYGLEYIKSRYGSPVNAWAHENSAGWY